MLYLWLVCFTCSKENHPSNMPKTWPEAVGCEQAAAPPTLQPSSNGYGQGLGLNDAWDKAGRWTAPMSFWSGLDHTLWAGPKNIVQTDRKIRSAANGKDEAISWKIVGWYPVSSSPTSSWHWQEQGTVSATDALRSKHYGRSRVLAKCQDDNHFEFRRRHHGASVRHSSLVRCAAWTICVLL